MAAPPRTRKDNPMNRTNKLPIEIVSLGLLLLAATACRADDIEETTNAPAWTPSPRPFQPFTVGAQVGTLGYGGGADWRFLNHLGIGAAFNTFSYDYHGTIESASYDIHLHLQSEPLTLNVYPWTHSSFHISVGALLNQNRLSGSSDETITINNNTYSSPVLHIKQGAENPYLTVGGNLYFDHAHRFSLGGELGFVYTGKPTVSFTAQNTGGVPPAQYQQDVQSELSKIQHYANDFKFWPVAKVSLNVSF